MNEATATLAQLKKASKLTRLAFRKNGPKSYKRGQGALMNALLANDGATQRELVKILGWDRSALKDTVKKAERNGYVTIGDHEDKHTYTVSLTEEGKKIAEKRVAANDKTAEEILECLSARGGDRPDERHHREADPGHQGQGRQRQEEGPQGAPSSLLPLLTPQRPDASDRRLGSTPPASRSVSMTLQARPSARCRAFFVP